MGASPGVCVCSHVHTRTHLCVCVRERVLSLSLSLPLTLSPSCPIPLGVVVELKEWNRQQLEVGRHRKVAALWKIHEVNLLLIGRMEGRSDAVVGHRRKGAREGSLSTAESREQGEGVCAHMCVRVCAKVCVCVCDSLSKIDARACVCM